MRMRKQQQARTAWRRAAGVAVAAGVAGLGAFAASPAYAANTHVEYFDCGGTATALVVHDTHSETSWGTGKIIDGGSGTLIPTSFTQSAYDDTYGDYLFAPMGVAKGGGDGNHQQDAITCTQSFSATLGDLLAQDGAPPFGLPEWAQPSDLVTLTFTVTAVPRP
jgi:hypothetical protein